MIQVLPLCEKPIWRWGLWLNNGCCKSTRPTLHGPSAMGHGPRHTGAPPALSLAPRPGSGRASIGHDRDSGHGVCTTTYVVNTPSAYVSPTPLSSRNLQLWRPTRVQSRNLDLLEPHSFFGKSNSGKILPNPWLRVVWSGTHATTQSHPLQTRHCPKMG